MVPVKFTTESAHISLFISANHLIWRIYNLRAAIAESLSCGLSVTSQIKVTKYYAKGEMLSKRVLFANGYSTVKINKEVAKAIFN